MHFVMKARRQSLDCHRLGFRFEDFNPFAVFPMMDFLLYSEVFILKP